MKPSLGRVLIYGLALALVANVFLWWVSNTDDWFAGVVAVASGVTAVALVASFHLRPKWTGEALLAAFGVWTANLIEFATEDHVYWASRLRQCGFYASFALMALGAYVATREARER